jgi:hypothetical protein
VYYAGVLTNVRIPFVIAPMEAEAHCVFLDEEKLVFIPHGFFSSLLF